MLLSPTSESYNPLQIAYDHFNDTLFRGELPACLLTLQRKNNAFGYHSHKRFVRRDGVQFSDEIAINPEYFANFPPIEVLQTLAHEMCHLWQAHFGKMKSRQCYHNREWGDRMESIGLMPSDTGQPGGRKTGQHMADYPIEGGAFVRRAAELINDKGFEILWFDRNAVPFRQASFSPTLPTLHAVTGACMVVAPQTQENAIQALMRPASEAFPQNVIVKKVEVVRPLSGTRSKYVCSGCRLAAWAKPGAHLKCGDCDIAMDEE